MKVNGNLTFATLGSGELRNAIIERLPTAPTAFAGRIYYNTSDNLYYYNNGTDWAAFEAGTPTPAYGTVTGDSGTAPAASSGATILIVGGQGLSTVASTGPNTLTVNLSLDTNLTAATVVTGDFLAFADVSASSAARKTTVLNFLNDLDIPNGISSNGLVTRTAADTYAARIITGITNRITVSNGDGVAGAPNIDIAAGYAGQTSITTLGTVTTGVWNGTTLAIANGGTGQTSANAALNALLPTQTGNSGEFLTTNGTNTSWAALSLDSLSDVTITSPADGDVLTYQAGSPTGWIAAPASGGSAWNYDIAGSTFTTPSDGDIILKFIAVREYRLPEDLLDSQFYFGTPPTSAGVLTVTLLEGGSPTTLGTIAVDNAGVATPTLSEVTINEGDIITVEVTTADGMDDIILTLLTLPPSL
jgi:hypothetical protein